MGAKPKIGKLGGRLSEEEGETILADFQDTLLDFCESQLLSNGSLQGDEWCCADLENSPLSQGRRGSCSVNVRKGVFNDKNPAACPASGGMVDMWCAIFNVDRRDHAPMNSEDIGNVSRVHGLLDSPDSLALSTAFETGVKDELTGC